MKLLTALLFFSAAALSRGAEDITSILSPDGKGPDPALTQKFVDWVEPLIGEYPTHFKDLEEKKRIVSATEKVTEEIKNMSPERFQDAKLVTTLAYILAMGHNADLRTFAYARNYYERALALDPDNMRANYLYGMFLVSTGRYHFDGLPYLQKALALGERDAQFSISMLFYQKGDRQKALEQMQEYSRSRPKDKQVLDVIKLMQAGAVEFQKAQPLKPQATGAADAAKPDANKGDVTVRPQATTPEPAKPEPVKPEAEKPPAAK